MAYIRVEHARFGPYFLFSTAKGKHIGAAGPEQGPRWRWRCNFSNTIHHPGEGDFFMAYIRIEYTEDRLEYMDIEYIQTNGVEGCFYIKWEGEYIDVGDLVLPKRSWPSRNEAYIDIQKCLVDMKNELYKNQ